MAESGLSNEVNATTVLPAASNVSASTNSNGNIDVTWTNNDDSTDGGIDVERSTDSFSTANTVVTGLSPSTTSYTDTTVSDGKTYEYRIERNTDHATATSATASVTTAQSIVANTHNTDAAPEIATLSPVSASLGATNTKTTGDIQPALVSPGVASLAATRHSGTSVAQKATLETVFILRSQRHQTNSTPKTAALGVGSTTLAATSTATGSTTRSATVQPTTVTLKATTTQTATNPNAATFGLGTATIVASTEQSTSTVQSALAGYSDWVIGGQPINTRTDEITTHNLLTLAFRVSRQTLTNAVRPLKSDEGKVDVLITDDGGFVAIDRANGSNTYDISPPLSRQPLRQAGDYLVDRYEESVVEQTGNEWDVELELVPEADRTDSPSISQTPATDEFGFDTRYGQIATGSVDAELTGTGEGGVERYELIARLTFDQAHVWRAAFARTDGSRIKEIPDAPNVARDETDDDANTLTLTSPDQDTISDGSYVVLDWESERLNDAYQQITFTLAPL